MTLFVIPVHLSIVVCLLAWAIEAIDKRDKRRLAFIWSGSYLARGTSPPFGKENFTDIFDVYTNTTSAKHFCRRVFTSYFGIYIDIASGNTST
jgi:hypothetical protein